MSSLEKMVKQSEELVKRSQSVGKADLTAQRALTLYHKTVYNMEQANKFLVETIKLEKETSGFDGEIGSIFKIMMDQAKSGQRPLMRLNVDGVKMKKLIFDRFHDVDIPITQGKRPRFK